MDAGDHVIDVVAPTDRPCNDRGGGGKPATVTVKMISVQAPARAAT
jgi:hypothetical protein